MISIAKRSSGMSHGAHACMRLFREIKPLCVRHCWSRTFLFSKLLSFFVINGLAVGVSHHVLQTTMCNIIQPPLVTVSINGTMKIARTRNLRQTQHVCSAKSTFTSSQSKQLHAKAVRMTMTIRSGALQHEHVNVCVVLFYCFFIPRQSKPIRWHVHDCKLGSWTWPHPSITVDIADAIRDTHVQ